MLASERVHLGVYSYIQLDIESDERTWWWWCLRVQVDSMLLSGINIIFVELWTRFGRSGGLLVNA